MNAPDSGDTEEDERNVQSLIDSLNRELHAEEPAYLPLTVDGEQVTIYGVIYCEQIAKLETLTVR